MCLSTFQAKRFQRGSNNFMKIITVSKKACTAEANKAIIRWAQHKDKLIVAIDGYAGVGKTTLLERLSRMNSNILAVNRDDFVRSRKKVRALFVRKENRQVLFEREILDIKKIARLVSAFKRNARSCTAQTYDYVSGKVDVRKKFDTTKPIMAIEGVFMFHSALLNHLWDKRIYLDGNVDRIDKQRVMREKKKWGSEYFPETHPNSFIRYITLALKQYRKKQRPEKMADLVLYIE